MHPQINELLICYWLGVNSAYIRQDYADESLKQTSAPLERGKQINKYKNNIFTTFHRVLAMASHYFVLYQETSYRQVTLPISCRLGLR